MPGRSRFRGFARSQRRLTAWGIGPGSDGTYGEQQFTSTGNNLWTFGVVPAVDGLTIIRVRGMVEMRLAATDAAGSGMSGAMGLIIVDDRAFAAGAASVPRAFSDRLDDGWFWHQLFSIHPETTSLELNASMSLHFEIDTKAMRKIPVGQTLVGVTEIITEVGAVSLSQYIGTRVLVKLP